MTNFNFTIINDSRINAKISEDLSTIKDCLVKDFDGIEGLILVGGFGRGEGSVLVENNQIQPVNDYDIVMVTRQLVSKPRVKSTCRQLASDLGIQWVDIVNFRKCKLYRLKYNMHNYDFLNGGYFFYGDNLLLNLAPKMDPSKMPLVEGEILFFTRLWCFLGAFDLSFLNKKLDKSEKFFLKYQLCKAIIAFLDAMLISRNEYHHSYVEKHRRFNQFFSDHSELVELVNVGMEFKLRPYLDVSDNLIEFYFKVKKTFLRQMRIFVSRMYNKRFSSWDDYLAVYARTPKKLLKRSLAFAGKRELGAKVHIDLSQLFLAIALEETSIDDEYLNKANRHLSMATEKNCSKMSWDQARLLALKLRSGD